MQKKILFSVFAAIICTYSYSQKFPNVSNLPYQSVLPNPLTKIDSSANVENRTDWESHRSYLKDMLTYYLYGTVPPTPKKVKINLVKRKSIKNGKAEIREYCIKFERKKRKAELNLALIIPRVNHKLPIVIKNDRFFFDIDYLKEFDEERYYRYKEDNRQKVINYVIDRAIEDGYIFCKFIRTDLSIDQKNNRDKGIFPLYPEYSWGTIAAWAWGYSLIIDWLEKQNFVDLDKIVITGHSRGGKTALCAGIYDERIAITVPNSSGAGGTASWRYFDAEHERQVVSYLDTIFPYWWNKSLFQFKDSVEWMPFDAHFNKALIAPRCLLNTHARHDFWANPYGTYLTHVAALPVFKLYNLENNLYLHWRDGGHNQDIEDWDALFDFCNWKFFGKSLEMDYNDNPFPAEYEYDTILNEYFHQLGLQNFNY